MPKRETSRAALPGELDAAHCVVSDLIQEAPAGGVRGVSYVSRIIFPLLWLPLPHHSVYARKGIARRMIHPFL